MKVMLFAGAGASVELGVPGMVGLAEEFLDHVKQWDVEPDLVARIMEGTLDVEYLIEALDRISTARSSLEALGEDLDALERVDTIRSEVEWFVQHTAERVVSSDARLLWGPVLRASSSIDLTLVTTNYDRAIELAANGEGVRVDDGFAHFGDAEAASWVGFSHGDGTFPLIKLHGSTDWYADGDLARPTKLRHPMPLFGRAVLEISDGRRLGSALVLPSREKLLTRDPYPRSSQMFLNAADRCDVAIFVGSSLRDHHVRSAAQTTARRVPVFIVNPDGDTFGVTGVEPIGQFASTFLMATLPNALLQSDPIAELRSAGETPAEKTGTLEPVRVAIDVDVSVSLRCGAIDQLDEMEVTLDPELLRQLLCDDDPTVARYALGLIPLSAARDTLIAESSASKHSQDQAFQDDVEMLQAMLRRES